MFSHLLEFLVSTRRQPRRKEKRKKKEKRETKMCVGDFFASGEDSFFLPVAFAAGSTRPLRDINYIFQRWMQFRNKNPLNMSHSCESFLRMKKKNKRKHYLYSFRTHDLLRLFVK